jgi:MbtH protein
MRNWRSCSSWTAARTATDRAGNRGGRRGANGNDHTTETRTVMNEDATIYAVVVNHEEQYSIWPAERELPLGWRPAGFRGTKPECLAWIETVWTDMRPLSLRERMERGGN